MSKQNYIDWINSTFDADYERVEELYSGVEACKMIHMLWPDAIDITKLTLPHGNQPLSEKQALQNYKILEKSFTKLKIQVEMRPSVIVKGRLKDNLYMASWMMKFYMENVKNRFELSTYESDEYWDSPSVENVELQQPTALDAKEKFAVSNEDEHSETLVELGENIPFEEDIRISDKDSREEETDDVMVEGEEKDKLVQGSENVYLIPRNSIKKVVEVDWTPDPAILVEYDAVSEEFCQTDVCDEKEMIRKDEVPEEVGNMEEAVYDQSQHEDQKEQDDTSSVSSDGVDDVGALLTEQHADSDSSSSEDESSDSSEPDKPTEVWITSVRLEDPTKDFPRPDENKDIEEANYKQ